MRFSGGEPGRGEVLGRDQADGALSYAAVTRGGLRPPAPSLCRYAERPIDLIWLSGLGGSAVNTNYRHAILAAILNQGADVYNRCTRTTVIASEVGVGDVAK